MEEQTGNNRARSPDGKFLPQNAEGNRFKPGESGNPAGRPRVSLTAALREYLEDNPKELAAMAKAIVQRVKKGSASHASLAFDRLDGRVVEEVLQDVVIDLLQPGVTKGIYPVADDDDNDDQTNPDPPASADD